MTPLSVATLHFKGAEMNRLTVKPLDRTHYPKSFEETLRQCQGVIETFQGSRETLEHIQRVEQCLKKLVQQAS